jgi:hypothetical protein
MNVMIGTIIKKMKILISYKVIDIFLKEVIKIYLFQ